MADFRTLGEALDERGVNSKIWAEKLNISVPYFYSTVRKAEQPGDSFMWRVVVKTIRDELRIIPVNGGWRIMTIREYIDDFHQRENEINRRLGRGYGN